MKPTIYIVCNNDHLHCACNTAGDALIEVDIQNRTAEEWDYWHFHDVELKEH